MSTILGVLFIVPSIVLAQGNWNNYQPLLPGKNASVARTSNAYTYGYPTYGNSQPNVKAQWKFTESSGNIVDTVSSITLVASGSPTYSVNYGFPYNRIAPGITYGTNIEHNKLSATTALNIGASDHFVIEWWAASTSTIPGGVEYYFSLQGNGSTTDYGMLAYQTTTTSTTVQLRSDDLSTSTATFTTSNWHDGVPKKFRLVGNRAGNIELFINGVSQGTASLAGVASKVFTNSGIRISGQFNGGGANFIGTFLELRFSIGTDVLSNNSGGPNGG